MTTAPIPTFYLYGEPEQGVSEGFVHVESLDDRSRPSEWTIQPHMHRDLNHMILIAEGGGAMRAEEAGVTFQAPCLLVIPARVVHGFAWHRESRGSVITIADSYLGHLLARDGDLAALFHHPAAVALREDDRAAVEEAVGMMARELNWSAPGQRAAVEAALLAVMVRALRRTRLSGAPAGGEGRQAALVARFRDRVEQRFRQREPIARLARDLGVSPTALRLACAQVAGTSPRRILDDRALLEARRLLLYSNLSVGEVAYSVGFEDQAYFSRFFTRHVGQCPRAYRASQGRGNGESTVRGSPSPSSG